MNGVVKVPGFGPVYAVFSGLTEAMDLVDALIEALPKHLQKQAKDMLFHEKLEFLYENFEHVDLVKAVQNVVYNEIMDRLNGRIEGAKRGAAERLRGSSGWSLGVSGRSDFRL